MSNHETYMFRVLSGQSELKRVVKNDFKNRVVSMNSSRMIWGHYYFRLLAKPSDEPLMMLATEWMSEAAADMREKTILLNLAAMDGDMAGVQYLISQGTSVSSTDSRGNSPLKIAIMNGHVSITKYLREAGAQLSYSDSIDLGVRLCRSAAQGDIAKVQSLIACNVSINSCDYDQRTALHLAAAYGHQSVVEFLISSGIDIGKKDKLGREAADDAITAGHVQVSAALKRDMQTHSVGQIACLDMDTVDFLEIKDHQTFGPHLWLVGKSKSEVNEAESNCQASDYKARSVSPKNDVNRNCAYLKSHSEQVECDVCLAKPNSSSIRSTNPSKKIESREAPFLVHKRSCQQDDYAFMSLADDFPDPISGCPWAYGEDGGEGEAGLGSLGTSAASVGTASVGSTGSLRLRNHAAPGATVLVIDIKGFTAGCAAMSAAEVGEWVAGFYQRVDSAAAAHGVRKAEVRGDCCICVAGTAAAVPWAELGPAARGPAPAADGRSDQVTRMLAFAADLCAKLATLSYPGGRATSARMGLATGDLSFLVGEGGGGGGFVSVQGDAVRVATRMEALSEPGTVLAHRSAIDKWVAEGAGAGGAPRDAPKTVQVDCGDGEAEAAAAYDCAARAFRRPAPGLPLSLPPRAGGGRKVAAPLSGFGCALGGRGGELLAKRSRARSQSIW